MLCRLFIFASCLYCWCEAAYELDVLGEAQHGYFVAVNIGYPPQNMKLIIDTGSANFAVAVTPPIKGSDNFFHYTQSESIQKLNSHIEIKYVQGEWSGFLATDLISISKNHSVRSEVACMTSIHDVFDINSKFAGILGLAYPALAKPNSSILPLFDTIRKSENINNVFSLSLCGPYFSSMITSCGKLHLGFISALHYTGQIVYSPFVKEQFYEITLTMIKVGLKKMTVNCKELNNPRSYIDTGSTQLMVPRSIYHEIVSSIKTYIAKKMPGNFWFNETAACIPKNYFNISFFPDLTLSFYHTDESSFDLIASPQLYLLPWKESSVRNTCFVLGIGISDFGTIIGSTLLKGFYIVFNRENKQMGFANSSQPNSNSFIKFPIFVPNTNYSNCKHMQSDSTISVGAIIFLLFILMLTILLLYRFVLWAIRLKHSDSRSDTSSLVGEEYGI